MGTTSHLRSRAAPLLVAAVGGGVWRRLPRTRTRTATIAAALWIVTGLGSIGVGLFPLDHSQGAHYAVALPIFAVRPLALAVTARTLMTFHRPLGNVTWVVAGLTLAGVIGFGLVGADG